MIYDEQEDPEIVRLRLRLELDAARAEVQHLRGCIARLLRYANLPSGIPGMTYDDKIVLSRWLRGVQRGADHIALQHIAVKIRKMEESK